MNKIIFTPRERNWDNYVLRKKKSSWSGLTKFVTDWTIADSRIPFIIAIPHLAPFLL